MDSVSSLQDSFSFVIGDNQKVAVKNSTEFYVHVHCKLTSVEMALGALMVFPSLALKVLSENGFSIAFRKIRRFNPPPPPPLLRPDKTFRLNEN
jgi:hypothetical protein